MPVISYHAGVNNSIEKRRNFAIMRGITMIMKQTAWTVLGLGLLAAALPALGQDSNAPTDYSKIFKNDDEKIGYAIGLYAGNPVAAKLKPEEAVIDYDAAVRGFRDALTGATPKITVAQEREILDDFSRQLQTNHDAIWAKLGKKNAEEGAVFLLANSKAPGVITNTSGLQYKILAKGSGDKPTDTDLVKVNYRAMGLDRKEFDSSYNFNKPAEFQLGNAIKGWGEALRQMQPGSKWELYVPGDLGYGATGRPPNIGPNATLIFELELVSFSAAPINATTSDIIKVPSQAEMDKGAKIETIRQGDLERVLANQKAGATNK